ncbi:glucose-1-phosphate thymidylyltransferase RfbA [bacterium]|nr:glucose-1-phosphate thymidylyltransferase RfbA [bacterium]
MKRKGIILAGGSGSRLFPLTRVVCKQLLPVYDKPMVYYPLSVLMLTDVRDILIISTPEDLPAFEHLFGDGSRIGLNIVYAEQPRPEGLAQAFIIGKEFLDGAPAVLILGDNMICAQDLTHLLRQADIRKHGATIFGYRVKDPSRYGVVEFDENKKVLSIEEKPAHPRSDYAVPGLYFYDERVCEMAASLIPSARGEIEITDLNRLYLKEGSLQMELLGRGTIWMDMGTHDSLLEAGFYVHTIETRQGLQIACPEEIAFHKGWVGHEIIEEEISRLGRTDYAGYLKEMLEDDLAHRGRRVPQSE